MGHARAQRKGEKARSRYDTVDDRVFSIGSILIFAFAKPKKGPSFYIYYILALTYLLPLRLFVYTAASR